MKTRAVTDRVWLRPVEEAELADMLRFYSDPEATGEYQWFGFRLAKARDSSGAGRRTGWLTRNAAAWPSASTTVAVPGMSIGGRSARPATSRSGFALFPEHRGRGVGTEAQRQLVDYLFATTPVHRLQAGTEVDNIAEQLDVERVGFRREGVARGLHLRDGSWRDGIFYGLLRDDPRDPLARPSSANP